ncbi:MAG TPA: NAD+ synthase [Gammaproteobacteria bacterium]|nr:NAD+ synthase [Gammaproteobacteria bacterium]
MTQRSIRLFQMNATVGDFSKNLQKLERAADQARADGISILIAPELALTGYPPEDLLLRPALIQKLDVAETKLCEISEGLTLCVGLPTLAPKMLRDCDPGDLSFKPTSLNNSLVIYQCGRRLTEYHKNSLPNYQVFDERRYFVAGTEPKVCAIEGIRIGLLVCEDVWVPEIVEATCALGVDFIVVVNASPFAETKIAERYWHLRDRASKNHTPIAYVNMVGGQDELVFDGGSFVVDRLGEVVAQANFFAEEMLDVTWNGADLVGSRLVALPSKDWLLYEAIVTGVRDYFAKTGFKKAVVGLSGGIDSALTLVCAVDALGAENVHAVMMPYLYTAEISVTDATRQAEVLGCEFSILSIEPMVREFMGMLGPSFEGHPVDATEENIQSRCRGVLLMALSNKTNALVLTTGNKSEMAVGYATLYGDMAGGFAVLKDVWKTRVYDLARFVNRDREVIPERVISRPPSAELAPGQADSDSLPPYNRLDQMLSLYIESDQSPQAIIDSGFDSKEVKRICRLVDINEYKRRQSAVGPRVTARGFGRDRRYPIANRWSF